MKIYQIPKSPCPIRVQMSDDERAAAIQCRDEDNVPFFWLSISPELARSIIEESGMKIVYELPDTPEAQISGPDPGARAAPPDA